jgi:tRNA A-37 threonylcarbamoyl transferase component Bud32
MKGQVLLGRYQIDDEVGQGGMATVYSGVDLLLNRKVAIKLLHRHLCQREEARSRFNREAKVIAKLKHPNIVEVYDYSGEKSDISFIVEEFVEGKDLQVFLEEFGSIQPEVAALIVIVVARALQHAHEQGVIHRDVKPQNIVIRKDGIIKLMDFGVAHVVDMEHLTVTGQVLGSPAHMSPEQIEGRALDGRTDVFSLGTMFYQLCTNKLPFEGETTGAILRAIAEVKFKDIRQVCKVFPDDLHEVLSRMFEREPDKRYQSAKEVADALEKTVRPLGLLEPDKEAARFFVSPQVVAEEMRKRVAEARLEKAMGYFRKGAYPALIRELNVVLALDKANKDALLLLKKGQRAERTRRLARKALVWTLVLGMASLAGIAVYLFLAKEEQEGVVVREVVLPERLSSEDNLAVSQRRAAVEIAIKNPPLKKTNTKTQTPEITQLETVKVTIHADPPAVAIKIDGRFVAFGTTGEMELAKGKHTVELSHPRCEVCRDARYDFYLDPKNPPRAPLRFSIKYNDATILVKADRDGVVFVNGVKRGVVNKKVDVPVLNPNPSSASVLVKFVDGTEKERQCVLSPGAEIEMVF